MLIGVSFGDNLIKPNDVAIDKDGNIFVLTGHDISMYNSKGGKIRNINERISKFFIDVKKQTALFNKSKGKNIHVYELKHKDILEYARYLRTKPNLELMAEKIFYPEHIDVGPDGKIYAVGEDVYYKSGKIGIIDPADGHTIMAFGEFTREDKPYGLWNPHGIAVDSGGNIYVANQGPYCVKKFDKNGKFIKKWGKRGSGRGEFKNPVGIAVDKRDDSVYVLDAFLPSGVFGTAGQPEQMRIQKFTKDGKFIKKWGERLGIAWNPFLVYPRITGIPEIDIPAGIVVDSKGYVYIFERGKRRINKYTPDGKLILQWGGLGKGKGEFYYTYGPMPVGMAIDKDDNIYVVDTDNNRIQKFDSNGKFLMEIK